MTDFQVEKLTQAFLEIATSLNRCAKAIERLGTNDAATRMGAIEMLAKETRDGLYTLSTSVDGLAEKL